MSFTEVNFRFKLYCYGAFLTVINNLVFALVSQFTIDNLKFIS